MTYFAYTDVETFLNITLTPSGQTTVAALIPAISSFAESYCNRTWGDSTAYTDTFDGGHQVYFPKHAPISSLTSLSIDGTALTSEEYFNYSDYLRLDRPAASGHRNVVLVYVANNPLPEDLKHALIRWTGELFKSSEDAGKTAESVKFGSASVTYKVQDGLPAFVELVLNRYRLMPV